MKKSLVKLVSLSSAAFMLAGAGLSVSAASLEINPFGDGKNYVAFEEEEEMANVYYYDAEGNEYVEQAENNIMNQHEVSATINVNGTVFQLHGLTPKEVEETPTPVPTGSVSVLVTDSNAKPVKGATVELLQGNSGMQAKTDENGYAHFADLDASLEYEARVVEAPEVLTYNISFFKPVVVTAGADTQGAAYFMLEGELPEEVKAVYIGGIIEVDENGKAVRTIADFTGKDENEVYYELSDRLGELEGYKVFDYERQYDEETGSVTWIYYVQEEVKPEEPKKEEPKKEEPKKEDKLPETGEAFTVALPAAIASLASGLGVLGFRRRK